MGNSTTIEHWEKDKVATLVRRGKIREVSLFSSNEYTRNNENTSRSNFHTTSVRGGTLTLFSVPIPSYGVAQLYRPERGSDISLQMATVRGWSFLCEIARKEVGSR